MLTGNIISLSLGSGIPQNANRPHREEGRMSLHSFGELWFSKVNKIPAGIFRSFNKLHNISNHENFLNEIYGDSSALQKTLWEKLLKEHLSPSQAGILLHQHVVSRFPP